LGGWDAYVAIQYDLTPTPCTGIQAYAYGGADPVTDTTEVFASGSATGCPHPLYQYWVLAPRSSTWQLGQAYANNSCPPPESCFFHWTIPGMARGVYIFQVWTRDVSSAGIFRDTLGSWDAYGYQVLIVP
jgi:hypothetical protein